MPACKNSQCQPACPFLDVMGRKYKCRVRARTLRRVQIPWRLAWFYLAAGKATECKLVLPAKKTARECLLTRAPALLW